MILNSQLESADLVIRPFVATDAAHLVRLLSDPLVHRYVGDGCALSPAQAELWVVRSGENLARYGYGTGAVVRRQDEEVVGWAGFARPPGGLEEVIYGFGADHWRRGYGTQVLRAMIEFARARRITPLHALAYPKNAASIALLMRHGFVCVEPAYKGDANSSLYRLDV